MMHGDGKKKHKVKLMIKKYEVQSQVCSQQGGRG